MPAAAPEEFGPYLVYEELGMGGMAAVHRAETRGIEGFRKPIALKRMLPGVAANDDFVEAFIREARIASHLRHVNVAQTYELGKVGGTYFIAMELVTGRNLRQLLRHCAQLTGPMPVPVTLNILNQICDALDYAHNLCDESGQRLGIIHRDVSPSNIIVSGDGVVKLIDFGIAKASAAGMQTMSGMLKGKFGYMAPEYIAGSIDARADLFALGVIAHELLTNRPLFTTADDMETLSRVRTMPIKPPSARNPKVPKEIDELVMTALARDPERRWQQASALRSAMTTTTKRLGLEVMNREVAEWIDWVFAQGKRDELEVTVEESTDVDAAAARTPVTTLVDRDARDDLRKTTKRPPDAPASASAAGLAIDRPLGRTLLGSSPDPARAALAPRHVAVAPVAGSNPGIALRPSTPKLPSDPPLAVAHASPNPAVARLPSFPPGYQHPAPSGAYVPPAGEDPTLLDPPAAPVGPPLAAPPPAPRPRDGGDRLALVVFLVIVVAVASAVVVYFALQ